MDNEEMVTLCALVAIHKSGTHLVTQLIRQLGYEVVGHGLEVTEKTPYRGLPIVERDFEFMLSVNSHSCFVTHSLPLFLGDYGIVPALLRVWVKRSFPIIFNFRDPRAVICSFLDYVLNRHHSKEYTVTPFTKVCADVFTAEKNEDRRLHLTIEMLGDYLDSSYRKNAWLLKHPKICTVNYEELCGKEGGGSDLKQIEAICRIRKALHFSCNEEKLIAPIYTKNSRTFNKGLAYGWKERFKKEHHLQFEKRYGDILDMYGYIGN